MPLKNWLVKLDHLPRLGVNIKKYLKPPPSHFFWHLGRFFFALCLPTCLPNIRNMTILTTSHDNFVTNRRALNTGSDILPSTTHSSIRSLPRSSVCRWFFGANQQDQANQQHGAVPGEQSPDFCWDSKKNRTIFPWCLDMFTMFGPSFFCINMSKNNLKGCKTQSYPKKERTLYGPYHFTKSFMKILWNFGMSSLL